MVFDIYFRTNISLQKNLQSVTSSSLLIKIREVLNQDTKCRLLFQILICCDNFNLLKIITANKNLKNNLHLVSSILPILFELYQAVIQFIIRTTFSLTSYAILFRMTIILSLRRKCCFPTCFLQFTCFQRIK